MRQSLKSIGSLSLFHLPRNKIELNDQLGSEGSSIINLEKKQRDFSSALGWVAESTTDPHAAAARAGRVSLKGLFAFAAAVFLSRPP